MCYAPFFVATSSLTGRGSKRASKKEGAGWAGTGGGGGVPVFVPCPQPGVIRAWKIGAWTVSTSLAPFSTRMLKDEKRLKNEVGVHENIRALGAPVGGRRRGGTPRRGCLIFSSKRWRTTFSLFSFFFFPSRSHRPGWATVERERRPRRVTLHSPAHNRPAADTRR